jgi:hypothetical protein
LGLPCSADSAILKQQRPARYKPAGRFFTKSTKSVFSYFLSFSVLLFLTAFVSALKTPFGAFESYFYGLGSTVTHKKFFLFDTQKLPKIREFLAWDLFCNIDMELVTGLEPATEDCF